MPDLTPQEFAARWAASRHKETAAYVSHFEDLCRLVGHPTPTEMDSVGDTFTYQKANLKESGKLGFADVWYKEHFGWEYKGKGEDLAKAYGQLLQYRDNLANPPLLIVCDFNNVHVHTNFNGTVSATYTVTLDQIADSSLGVDGTALSGIELLRACFTDPDALRPDQTNEALTEEAAERFGKIAESLRVSWGNSNEEVAVFLTRLLFCMFASDVGLLPNGIVTTMIETSKQQKSPGPTPALASALSELFEMMSKGGNYGPFPIPYFNGGLFTDGATLRLDGDTMGELLRADTMNWAEIEPSVFGTLFERILNPEKRSQFGAHYTSRADIERIVQPVLMQPLETEWKALAARLTEQHQDEGESARDAIQAELIDFLKRLGALTVLDPACGSGNFLYVGLAMLKALEQKVIAFGAEFGIIDIAPIVHPRQLYGIEIDPYAHSLASIVVWIGYLQWKRRNGYSLTEETPILQPLDNVRLMNGIVNSSKPGAPREPEWPATDVIVGNPPFLGGKLLRRGMGDEEVEALFAVRDGRVRRESDLCCYWHEKARAMVEQGRAKRVGLLATQAIRGGANRDTLRRIKMTGDIFFAESDRPWILDGAAVHVSMVGFDDGTEANRVLDGQPVDSINANLTIGADLTTARRLKENLHIAFMGDTKGGAFDIDSHVAGELIAQPNPHGKSNADVIRPWINGRDVTDRPRNKRIIDFGPSMSLEDASRYEAPFEYVKKYVQPSRVENKRRIYAERWWIHVEPRQGLRAAIVGLPRFIVTPTVSKHRLFSWTENPTLPDHQLIVFARQDDYFFGILNSHPHELWARATGTQLREVESGFRYTPTTTFETFPFPQPDDAQKTAISAAAHELDSLLERWLNPEPDPDTGMAVSESILKGRTLTNLYNQRPEWLVLAHKKLDEAVLAAYGWPTDITDQQILERLLELNLSREAV